MTRTITPAPTTPEPVSPTAEPLPHYRADFTPFDHSARVWARLIFSVEDENMKFLKRFRIAAAQLSGELGRCSQLGADRTVALDLISKIGSLLDQIAENDPHSNGPVGDYRKALDSIRIAVTLPDSEWLRLMAQPLEAGTKVSPRSISVLDAVDELAPFCSSYGHVPEGQDDPRIRLKGLCTQLRQQIVINRDLDDEHIVAYKAALEEIRSVAKAGISAGQVYQFPLLELEEHIAKVVAALEGRTVAPRRALIPTANPRQTRSVFDLFPAEAQWAG